MMATQILALALVLPVQALYLGASKPATGYVVPKGNMCCMEGDPAYMEEALQRLQKSNMQLGWKDSKVTKGACSDVSDGGFTLHMPDMCFPNATLWWNGNPTKFGEMLDMDKTFTAMYKKAHPELSASEVAKLNIQCMFK